MSHLSVGCRRDDNLPLSASPETEDILLYNHNTVITLKKFNVGEIVLSNNTWFIFKNPTYPSNVLYDLKKIYGYGIQSRIMHCIYFHVSSDSVHLEEFLACSLSLHRYF